ncbi:MAG: 4Fe-4S binding protein [Saprospiraceae bacterium]|nr:4Fe-4S binding protein [Saprospiraceae bacterium]
MTTDQDTTIYRILKISGKVMGIIGLLILVLALLQVDLPKPGITLTLSLLFIGIGVAIYTIGRYQPESAGIKNDHNWHFSLTSRGVWGYMLGIVLTGFYIILYWYPSYLGFTEGDQSNTGLVAFFDPLSQFLKGEPASQWFVYGALYTMAILAFGIKFIWKYRHNMYQIIRTISVMFFQLGFAFLIPEILLRLNYPYNDFKNMWPLNYYFFDKWNVDSMISSGTLGMFMLVFGVALIFVISPLLTYFYGKRWYCSWVCGCGGLAETAGDPFRHLSDKSLKAWRLERWLVHGVLAFSVVMTAAVIFSYLNSNPEQYWLQSNVLIGIITIVLGGFIALTLFAKKITSNLNQKERYIISGVAGVVLILVLVNGFSGRSLFFIDAEELRKTYGFLIGATFSGVIGVGFYPIFGSRVWCRFGCPMAAILGIQQNWFSRFRITTNGGQCISCGNCSTYCEMGIDVRAYAQKGQNIVRASCVGCGICAAVCPRGVLKLENGSVDVFEKTKKKKAVHVSEENIGLIS